MGAAVPPPGAAPGGTAYQPGPAATGMSDNAASALCYVLGLITGILFLVLAPYNQNKVIRFHAFQSIFLNVAWIAFWMVFNIVFAAMHLFSLLFLSPLIGLVFFILWIYMIISAYQGKMVVLPVIGPIAQGQA
ncbi:MAG: hypothetical protein ABSG79_07425 [Bryobacteraceae bacterium]